jgi:voltage-gated potassium channel
MVDESKKPAATAQAGARAALGSDSVVVASFKRRHVAERMVASLGHSFRHQARKERAAAHVITRNPDGSFRLVQSRVLTATGVVANLSKFAAIVAAGFMGIGRAIKNVTVAGHRAHQRQSGVGEDADRLAKMFDKLGPQGACVLLVFTDEVAAQAAAARADERGDESSHYARTEFLALLDRLGTAYDWIRPAVAELAPRHHQQAAPSFDGLPRRQRRRLVLWAFLRTIATVAVTVVAYFIAPLDQPISPTTIFVMVLLTLAVLAMIGRQIWSITQADYPTLRAVEALAFIVPIYLVLFAIIYYLMNHANPATFGTRQTRLDSLYFSATVFTTVGFGDISAKTQPARAIVLCQMVLDLVFLGLVVRLAVNAVKIGQKRRTDDGRTLNDAN